MTEKDRLSELIRKNIIPGEIFLTSGRKSNYYFDGRLVSLSAEGAYWVGKKVFELAKEAGAEAVGGPTLGADPIIGAVLAISYLEGKPLAGFIVRGGVKEHGTQKLIEGNLPRGGKVAVFDDTITSGGSLFRAIEAVEREGCRVVKVITLLDRQEGGSEEMRRRGYDFKAIFRADSVGNIDIN